MQFQSPFLDCTIHCARMTSRVEGMEENEYEDNYPFPVCVSEMKILSCVLAILIIRFCQHPRALKSTRLSAP